MFTKNWKKHIIPPVSIYGAIFLFISFLVGFKINQNAFWVWIVSLLILSTGLFVAINHVKPKMDERWRLGATWVVVLVVMDLILTIPFTGIGYFFDWRSYVSYLLVLLAPVVLVKK